MINEEKLIEKLLAIEALFAGATTIGERDAAASAMDRIKNKLKNLQKIDPAREYKFTFPDMWARKLFTALLRRYGINPYRYYRQKHTTVMAKISKSFVDETLWPEFQELNKVLTTYLNDMTNQVISRSIYKDESDVDVIREME